jgi:mRNA-degrading endonuclease RelE of RelBE toxin-antitoxin system
MKRVLFRPQAVRDLERLPNRDRDQVEDAIDSSGLSKPALAT